MAADPEDRRHGHRVRAAAGRDAGQGARLRRGRWCRCLLRWPEAVGGIVATLSDQAAVARRVQTLLGLPERSASASSTAAFSVASADVNGTTVTTITLQALGGAACRSAIRAVRQRRGRGWSPVPGAGLTSPRRPSPRTPRPRWPRTRATSAAVGPAGHPQRGCGLGRCRGRRAAPGDRSPTAQTRVVPDHHQAVRRRAGHLRGDRSTVDGDIASLKALLFVK